MNDADKEKMSPVSFQETFFVLVVIILILFAVLCFVVLWTIKLSTRLRQAKADFQERVQKSLSQSRSVMVGQVAEHFAPILPGFPYNPKDARFLGQPVDFLVFDGLSDEGNIDRVSLIFCEIKTGNATLSEREKAIRAAVKAQRVSYQTLRIDADGQIHVEPLPLRI